MRYTILALLVCTLLGLGAGAQNKPAAEKRTEPAAAEHKAANLPSQATINSFLEHMFGYDPTIKWQVLQVVPAEDTGLAEVLVSLSKEGQQPQPPTRLFITPDGRHALTGDMIPFGADPFARDRAELERRANGPAKGPANAPVTIVEFGDLECPSCKAAQPIVEKLLGEEPDARFIFQQFPLTAIHPWAMTAAKFGDCLGRENNPAFWKFADAVYGAQDQITPANAEQKLTELASSSGADGAQTAKCAAEPATAKRVEESIDLGKAVVVTGTPTLFIGGRKVSNLAGLPYEMLKALVEYQAKHGK